MLSVSTVWTAVVPPLAFACVLYAKYTMNKHRLPLPPGPRGFPIIGNLFEMPKGVHEWVVYDKWCKKYNTDILYLNMAGFPTVVINSYDVAIDLLEKRSSVYSGRSRMPMINELMRWDFNSLFMDYGERWLVKMYRSLAKSPGQMYYYRRKRHRKLMHSALQPSAVHEFHTQQLKAARNLVVKLPDTRNVIYDVRQMAGETIISIAYGLDVQPKDDPYVNAAEEAVQPLLQVAVPGAFFVDSIPMLKYVPEWVPGAAFKRKAKKWRDMADRMLNKPFEALQKAMEDGTAKPSFGLHGLQTIQTQENTAYTLEDIKFVAATMYQTGSDTTVSAITFCILSLLDHPQVVQQIQNEIDTVTEMARLPDFCDQPLLPYLAAVINETLRFWATVPLAFPHTADSEDSYKGFRIPAGSLIIPNTWAMLHNDQIYEDPFAFKPERFLENDDLTNSHVDVIWGFGRRVCPGRHMAYNSIWITIATILSVYNVQKAVDAHGKVIEPSHDFASSILLMPTPFHCKFSIRSPAAKHLLDSLVSEGD